MCKHEQECAQAIFFINAEKTALVHVATGRGPHTHACAYAYVSGEASVNLDAVTWNPENRSFSPFV